MPISDAYSFKSHYVTANGIRLHYVDEGPPNGRPLLLLHGNPTWSYLYRNIIPPLTAAGYRVLALDSMGFGYSDKPVEVEAHTIQRHVANLHGFIDALNLRQVTLVGHAWGAVFALAYAAHQADNVAALVFLNGDTYLNLPFFVKMSFKILFTWPITGELLARRLNWSGSIILKSGTYRRQNLNAAVMAGYMDIFSKYEDRAGVLGLPRMLPLTQNNPSTAFLRQLETQLPGFQMPVLFLAGDHDPGKSGETSQRLAKLMSNAKVYVLKDAGHFMEEDTPAEIVSLTLAFLKEHLH